MSLESYKVFLRKNKIEIMLFFLLIISLGLKFYRLNNPNSYYFDEIYFAFTAEEMAKGSDIPWGIGGNAPKGFAYEWVHPPLGKEISALGILIFGDNTFGWRFFQALFGGFGALFIYLLAKELFQSKRAGLIAAFLFTFESFIFVLSRITMVDVFLMVFTLLASLFFVLYVKKGKFYYLLLTGLFCGFSVSTKWSGILTLGFLGFLSFLVEVHKRKQVVDQKRKKIKVKVPSIWTLSIRMLPRLVLSFIVIPAAVYLLIYLPLFFHNHTWADFIELHKQMYYYHSGLKATHPYQSSWWQWLLLIRPIYLYLGAQGEFAAHIYAIGNPFIWWTGVGFLLYSLIEVARKEDLSLYFPILSVFAYWLHWAISPRKLTFLYHFLPSLPFILLIIAYFLDLLWVKSRYGRAFVILYLVCALGTFIYFYPILAAIPVSNDSLGRFFWLKSWR